MKICPKCKRKVEELIVEQEFTTTIQGTLKEENLDLDIEAGYTDLKEWVDNMLIEKDKLKILGCEKCL